MARPEKDCMDYFPHDTDARHDTKIFSLRIEHGLIGYATYFILLEYIYSQKTFELDMSNERIWKTLSKDIDMGIPEIKDIINFCIDVDLFNKTLYDEKNILTSDGIKKRSEVVIAKRKRSKEAYANSRVSAAETAQKLNRNDTRNETQCFISADKEKKRKEKESKEEKRKENNKEQQLLGDVFRFFNQNINPITEYQRECIINYVDDGMECEMILQILKDSVGKAERWNYAKKVLQNSLERNIKTLDQYIGAKNQKSSEKTDSTQQNKIVYTIAPDEFAAIYAKQVGEKP